jgi:hypothetical protein
MSLLFVTPRMDLHVPPKKGRSLPRPDRSDFMNAYLLRWSGSLPEATIFGILANRQCCRRVNNSKKTQGRAVSGPACFYGCQIHPIGGQDGRNELRLMRIT